jgi:nuclease S1
MSLAPLSHRSSAACESDGQPLTSCADSLAICAVAKARRKWSRPLSAWVLGLAAFAIPGAASAWGSDGHRLIAELAQEQLDEPTRRELDALLASEPGSTLASISTWADEHRAPSTAAWHYVNMPRGGTCTFDELRDCPSGQCVGKAIEKQANALAAEAPPSERLKALKYLVHLVADVHQPLHAGYEDDRGGNLYQLRAFDRGTNLHAVWDSGLIAHWPGGLPALRRAAVSARIDEGGDVRGASEWAEESCRIVARVGFYPGRKLDHESYLRRMGPVLTSRIALAARRTARLLRVVLAQRRPVEPEARLGRGR